MALKIRLRRMGRKKAPHYRIVIAESANARDGRFVANIGHYNPTTNPMTLVVDRDKALYWLGQGATPTDTVNSLLKKGGVFQPAPEGVVETVTTAASGAARGAGRAVKGAAGAVAGAATAAAGAVSGAASSAAGAVSGAASSAAGAASSAAGAVGDAASSAASAVADTVRGAVEAVTGGGDDAPAADAEAPAADATEENAG
ncbi:MAG TPA: 30S ribosomal protein S16 [Longimicrobium sp.]|jgi:small subunit ribosomal protein S16